MISHVPPRDDGRSVHGGNTVRNIVIWWVYWNNQEIRLFACALPFFILLLNS